MTRLTRLTLRAILVLGVLSSGALAAPASTLPLTNDQALDQCSDSQIGGSSLALRARGCMSSREGANGGGANGGGANGGGANGGGANGGRSNRGGANGGGANGGRSNRGGANGGGANGGRSNRGGGSGEGGSGEGGSGEGGSGEGASSRGRARAYVRDQDVKQVIIEPFNQCMSDLGRPDLQTASSEEDILEIVSKLQVPDGRLEPGSQKHAYGKLVALLRLSSSRWRARHSNLPSDEDPYYALVLQIRRVIV
ncbi:hypothetical protein C8R42DRAFT_722826 [Lentinula raphanica]|nr:hypothetical protein C8R42DRAFT_722826 [Lentinula raphanica]